MESWQAHITQTKMIYLHVHSILPKESMLQTTYKPIKWGLKLIKGTQTLQSKCRNQYIVQNSWNQIFNPIILFFVILLIVYSLYSLHKSSQDLVLYILLRSAWCNMLSDALKSYISCYNRCWFYSTRSVSPIICCLKSNTALKASSSVKITLTLLSEWEND